DLIASLPVANSDAYVTSSSDNWRSMVPHWRWQVQLGEISLYHWAHRSASIFEYAELGGNLSFSTRIHATNSAKLLDSKYAECTVSFHVKLAITASSRSWVPPTAAKPKRSRAARSSFGACASTMH